MSVLVPVVVDYVDEEARVVHFETARRGGAEISPGPAALAGVGRHLL